MAATYSMVPFLLIVKASDGDSESVDHILKHYSRYIAKRSLRPMKDEYGNAHMVLDENLRRRLETRLITKILSFEIGEEK